MTQITDRERATWNSQVDQEEAKQNQLCGILRYHYPSLASTLYRQAIAYHDQAVLVDSKNPDVNQRDAWKKLLELREETYQLVIRVTAPLTAQVTVQEVEER